MAAKKQVKIYSPKNIIDDEALQALTNVEDWQKQTAKDIKHDFNDLERLRYRDITERLKGRQNFAKFLMTLLVFQNIFVFTLFGLGLWYNKVQGLENLFSIIIAGTLAETTSLIYIIVKFLFSDIPYQGGNPPTPINPVPVDIK